MTVFYIAAAMKSKFFAGSKLIGASSRFDKLDVLFVGFIILALIFQPHDLVLTLPVHAAGPRN